jgi:hypothetical protein
MPRGTPADDADRAAPMCTHGRRAGTICPHCARVVGPASDPPPPTNETPSVPTGDARGADLTTALARLDAHLRDLHATHAPTGPGWRAASAFRAIDDARAALRQFGYAVAGSGG